MWARKEDKEYKCLEEWVQQDKNMVRSKLDSLKKMVKLKKAGNSGAEVCEEMFEISPRKVPGESK